MTVQDTALQVAKHLLHISAVKLSPEQPFTWASGWQSPIYCDNRLTLSHPEIRQYITDRFVATIEQQYPQANAIAGVATAGIPQAALVAQAMGLPMLYVRSKPKGHGRENLIEGEMPHGSQVVVIEDLISTGGSSIKAAQALQAAGMQVLGLCAIFTYGFPDAEQNFQKAGIPYSSLSQYEALLRVAVAENYVDEGQLGLLQQWREDPANWGK